MVLDGLVERLGTSFSGLGGVKRISEAAVAGTLKEVKRALLDSDVNLQVMYIMCARVLAGMVCVWVCVCV